MRSIISLAALIAGLWLLYTGYQRQESLVGHMDVTTSKLGQTFDGEGHTPTHVKYYVAGALLFVGGAIGLGMVKR